MYSIIHNQIVIQLIGFVALGIAFTAFQLNQRKQILWLQLWSNLLWSIHFFLLGAYTGSILDFLGSGRSYAFNKYRYRRWSGFVFWGFIAAFALATVLTWQGLISLLPATGTISGAFATWQPAAKAIRRISLISPPAWFTYNFISHSYAGMVTEIFLLSSILLGMYRLDMPRKQKRAVKLASLRLAGFILPGR